MNSALLPVPNSPYVVLKDDACLGKWAMQSGSIIGEKHIADLPEVKALKPDDVLLDIGAFYDTPLIFAPYGCAVMAYEAYADTFEALSHNCSAFPNVKPFHAAVGDGRRMATMGEKCEAGDNLGTRMVTTGDGAPSLRIDSLNLPRVDAVKMDIEGAEVMALNGMRETILRCRPRWMLIEVYDRPLLAQGFTRKDVFNFLKSVDYVWRVAIGHERDERFDLLATPK